MKVELSSDLTVKGTMLKVDGKAFKGDVVGIEFSQYRDYEYDEMGKPMEEVTRFHLCVTTNEMGDDNVARKVEYKFHHEDGESEETLMDRKDITPSKEEIIKDLANKFMGRKSVL